MPDSLFCCKYFTIVVVVALGNIVFMIFTIGPAGSSETYSSVYCLVCYANTAALFITTSVVHRWRDLIKLLSF